MAAEMLRTTRAYKDRQHESAHLPIQTAPMREASVVHLTWWVYAYRVPLLDELYRRLGNRFLVIAHRRQQNRNNQASVEAGEFPRLLLSGRNLELNHRLFDGLGTPLGLTVTPGLLIALLRIRPKIVISINFNAWTLVALLMGLPTIIFWEGTDHTERTAGLGRIRLRRWMAKRAMGFIANGSLSKQYLEKLGADSTAIFEGGQSALAPPSQLTARSANTRSAVLRFLFVGQLIPRKGCNHLIEAAAILCKKVGQLFELRILGEGHARQGLEKTAQQYGLARQIKFLGAVAPEEVWFHYAQADVFVLPTLHDNWPLVVLEAMLMEMPILLSEYAGSVPELIDEGSNGYSFDPPDHARLASLMEIYVSKPELVRDHGLRSKEIVQAYTPERIADVFMNALRHVNDKIGQPLKL